MEAQQKKKAEYKKADKAVKEVKPITVYVVSGSSANTLQLAPTSFDSKQVAGATDGTLRDAIESVTLKYNDGADVALAMEDVLLLRAAGQAANSRGFSTLWRDSNVWADARVEQAHGALGLYLVPSAFQAEAIALVKQHHFGGGSPLRNGAGKAARSSGTALDGAPTGSDMWNEYQRVAVNENGLSHTAHRAAVRLRWNALDRAAKEAWYYSQTGQEPPSKEDGGGTASAPPLSREELEEKERAEEQQLLLRSRDDEERLPPLELDRLAEAWLRVRFEKPDVQLRKLKGEELSEMLDRLGGKGILHTHISYRKGNRSNAAKLNQILLLLSTDWRHPDTEDFDFTKPEESEMRLGRSAYSQFASRMVKRYRERAAAEKKAAKAAAGDNGSSSSEDDEEQDEETGEEQDKEEGDSEEEEAAEAADEEAAAEPAAEAVEEEATAESAADSYDAARFLHSLRDAPGVMAGLASSSGNTPSDPMPPSMDTTAVAEEPTAAAEDEAHTASAVPCSRCPGCVRPDYHSGECRIDVEEAKKRQCRAMRHR